jgi:SAM-dependent methyltransferase
MSSEFGPTYAGAYDLLYQDKNYDEECRLLVQIFQEYRRECVRRILDLGCGTANHALRLAAHGYEVVGVDRSADMLRIAERKAQEQGLELRLARFDIRDVQLAETFDAVLMMFAVLGYQLGNSDVFSALRTARRHLSDKGLLVFDVWYGPAVLAQRPRDRVRTISTNGGTLLRTSSGELDIRRQLCTVHFRVWRLSENRVVEHTAESHRVRYFFPQELELFLDAAGFRLLRLGAFPDFAHEPDETTWNAIVVAEAAS